MSIYDVLQNLVSQVDGEVERLMEQVLELKEVTDAFPVMCEMRQLHRIRLDLCCAYDDGVDAIFDAVHKLDSYVNMACTF